MSRTGCGGIRVFRDWEERRGRSNPALRGAACGLLRCAGHKEVEISVTTKATRIWTRVGIMIEYLRAPFSDLHARYRFGRVATCNTCRGASRPIARRLAANRLQYRKGSRVSAFGRSH